MKIALITYAMTVFAWLAVHCIHNTTDRLETVNKVLAWISNITGALIIFLVLAGFIDLG